MLAAINFLTAIIWAVIKLLMALLLFGFAFIMTEPVVLAVCEIIADRIKNVCRRWEEIKEMERQEYGE